MQTHFPLCKSQLFMMSLHTSIWEDTAVSEFIVKHQHFKFYLLSAITSKGIPFYPVHFRRGITCWKKHTFWTTWWRFEKTGEGEVHFYDFSWYWFLSCSILMSIQMRHLSAAVSLCLSSASFTDPVLTTVDPLKCAGSQLVGSCWHNCTDSIHAHTGHKVRNKVWNAFLPKRATCPELRILDGRAPKLDYFDPFLHRHRSTACIFLLASVVVLGPVRPRQRSVRYFPWPAEQLHWKPWWCGFCHRLHQQTGKRMHMGILGLLVYGNVFALPWRRWELSIGRFSENAWLPFPLLEHPHFGWTLERPSCAEPDHLVCRSESESFSALAVGVDRLVSESDWAGRRQPRQHPAHFLQETRQSEVPQDCPPQPSL